MTGANIESLQVLREITFEIKKGDEFIVGNIYTHGNKAFSAYAIKTTIGAPAGFKEMRKISSQNPQFKRVAPFNKIALNDGLENLAGFYNENGYLNYKLVDVDYSFKKTTLPISEDKDAMLKDVVEVNVDLYIEEGPQALINNINIEGNRNISLSEIQKLVKFKKGDVFNSVLIEETATRIKELYNNKGYYYFKFKNPEFYLFDSELSQADVNFDIEEGPIVFVSSIVLKGNFRTESRVLIRKIDLKENEILTKAKVLDSEVYLQRLGLFSNVSIYPLDELFIKDSRHYHNMMIDVKESDFKSVKLGFGYDTDEKFRTFIQLRHNNLGSAGRSLRTSFRTNRRVSIEKSLDQRKYKEDRLSFNEFEVSGGYREPSLARRPFDIELDSSLSYFQKHRAAYDIFRWEAIFTAIKNAFLTKRLNTTLSWKLTSDKIFNASENEDNRRIVISSIYPELFIDYRNNPLVPTKGFLTQLKYEIGKPFIGSTFDYQEIYGKTTFYFPFFKKYNYFPSFAAGYLKSAHNYLIPVEKRYFLGGRGTLRGYGTDEFGAMNKDKPVGGYAFWNIRNNIKAPLYSAFYTVFFFDIGRLFYQYLPATKVKKTTGIGLSYESPIGAINLEIGYKLDKDPGESMMQAYFSIGNF